MGLETYPDYKTKIPLENNTGQYTLRFSPPSGYITTIPGVDRHGAISPGLSEIDISILRNIKEAMPEYTEYLRQRSQISADFQRQHDEIRNRVNRDVIYRNNQSVIQIYKPGSYIKKYK